MVVSTSAITGSNNVIVNIEDSTEISSGSVVGYQIEEIQLSKEIQEISATKIRAKMREDGKLK